MTRLVSLPLELLELILHSLDPHTLAQLARVAHLFYHATIPYLYRHVSPNRPDRFSLWQLARTILTNDEVAQMVQTFTMTPPGDPADWQLHKHDSAWSRWQNSPSSKTARRVEEEALLDLKLHRPPFSNHAATLDISEELLQNMYCAHLGYCHHSADAMISAVLPKMRNLGNLQLFVTKGSSFLGGQILRDLHSIAQGANDTRLQYLKSVRTLDMREVVEWQCANDVRPSELDPDGKAPAGIFITSAQMFQALCALPSLDSFHVSSDGVVTRSPQWPHQVSFAQGVYDKLSCFPSSIGTLDIDETFLQSLHEIPYRRSLTTVIAWGHPKLDVYQRNSDDRLSGVLNYVSTANGQTVKHLHIHRFCQCKLTVNNPLYRNVLGCQLRTLTLGTQGIKCSPNGCMALFTKVVLSLIPITLESFTFEDDEGNVDRYKPLLRDLADKIVSKRPNLREFALEFAFTTPMYGRREGRTGKRLPSFPGLVQLKNQRATTWLETIDDYLTCETETPFALFLNDEHHKRLADHVDATVLQDYVALTATESAKQVTVNLGVTFRIPEVVLW